MVSEQQIMAVISALRSATSGTFYWQMTHIDPTLIQHVSTSKNGILFFLLQNMQILYFVEFI